MLWLLDNVLFLGIRSGVRLFEEDVSDDLLLDLACTTSVLEGVQGFLVCLVKRTGASKHHSPGVASEGVLE